MRGQEAETTADPKLTIPAEHQAVLGAALRAPSAHNAQPWRLGIQADGSYLLKYDFSDKLDADPDDRDALLALGAFYETLSLSARAHGFTCDFLPDVSVSDKEMILGSVALSPTPDDAAPEPLALHIDKRATNRHHYDRSRALPSDLDNALRGLGCTFLDPKTVAPLVSRASVMAWKDARFVGDLKKWTRFDKNAPDGLSCECLNLNLTDRLALRFALWAGRLPLWLAWIYALRDVWLTRDSSAVVVIAAPDRAPLSLFEAGRRLLRSWVEIVGHGWSYHPISIVIDQDTAPELTKMAGVSDAVAIFRVGYTSKPAVTSRRRELIDIVR